MARHRDKIKDSVREKERYHQRRLVAIGMLGGICVQCGTNQKLEFHHIDPKEKSFSISKGWSRADFWEELKKCQLLCTSCHKKKTSEQAKRRKKPNSERIHGTWGMYRRGKCRCDPCREVFNEYRRNKKKDSISEKK